MRLDHTPLASLAASTLPLAVLLLALLPGQTHAADAPHSLWLGLGVEQSVNDPFSVQRGARLGLGWRARPWLEARAEASWLPHLGEAGHSLLAQQLSSELQIYPDISVLRSRVQLCADAVAWRSGQEAVTGEVALRAGLGVVRTYDDPEAFLAGPDDPLFVSSQDEWHPTPVLGLVGHVSWESWRLSTWVERTSYTEVVLSAVYEDKKHVWAGLSLDRRL